MRDSIFTKGRAQTGRAYCPTLHSSGQPLAAAELERVCRAWHGTMSVQVRQPGISRAEG